MKFWNVARRLAGGGVLLVGAWCLVFCASAQRVTLNFNPDWKFIKDAPAGAQAPAFNDSGWADVSAPHTYNDTDTFDDWSIRGHHGEQNQWGGRTWYRKTFTVPKTYEGKKIYIEFEAVRQVAEVYLNGKLLGTSKTGFIPFGFDLTPYIQFGKPNILAVMCDNRFMISQTTTSPGMQLASYEKQVNASLPDNVDDVQADQIPW